MTEPRTGMWLWFLVATLLAASAPACASAPPVAESAPPSEIVGLALPPSQSAFASSRPAPQSAAVPRREEAPPPRAPVGPVPSDTACGARIGDRAVRRSSLSRTLDAGLGNWLRGVDVEPKIERGHFQGWLVRSIYVGDPCWKDIDLQVGDIVNRVNRRPIERPEQAQAVWTGLRSSGEIVVEFLRGGQPHTLRFAVVDDGT